MKKIFVILLLLYGCVGGYAQITYKMQLRDFNRAALDSYPQRVISFQQTDSICHVTIQSSSVMADTSLLKVVLIRDYLILLTCCRFWSRHLLSITVCLSYKR